MNKQLLINELNELKNIKRLANNAIANAPDGNLYVLMNKNEYPQYYYAEKHNNKISKQYLKKEQHPLAKALAQKEYNSKIIKSVNMQEKAIEHFINNYNDNAVIDVYNKISKGKQKLIEPYILTDEQYIEQWKNSDSKISNSYPIDNGYMTENEEYVRSKSEKMIADKLYYLEVLYKYEETLRLSNNKVIFPDFTILNVKKRKNIYLEHLGMMDDPVYCKKAIEKIEMYQKNGIYLGEDLIVTMESSQKGLDMQYLEDTILRCCS